MRFGINDGIISGIKKFGHLSPCYLQDDVNKLMSTWTLDDCRRFLVHCRSSSTRRDVKVAPSSGVKRKHGDEDGIGGEELLDEDERQHWRRQMYILLLQMPECLFADNCYTNKFVDSVHDDWLHCDYDTLVARLLATICNVIELRALSPELIGYVPKTARDLRCVSAKYAHYYVNRSVRQNGYLLQDVYRDDVVLRGSSDNDNRVTNVTRHDIVMRRELLGTAFPMRVKLRIDDDDDDDDDDEYWLKHLRVNLEENFALRRLLSCVTYRARGRFIEQHWLIQYFGRIIGAATSESLLFEHEPTFWLLFYHMERIVFMNMYNGNGIMGDRGDLRRSHLYRAYQTAMGKVRCNNDYWRRRLEREQELRLTELSGLPAEARDSWRYHADLCVCNTSWDGCLRDACKEDDLPMMSFLESHYLQDVEDAEDAEACERLYDWCEFFVGFATLMLRWFAYQRVLLEANVLDDEDNVSGVRRRRRWSLRQFVDWLRYVDVDVSLLWLVYVLRWQRVAACDDDGVDDVAFDVERVDERGYCDGLNVSVLSRLFLFASQAVGLELRAELDEVRVRFQRQQRHLLLRI